MHTLVYMIQAILDYTPGICMLIKFKTSSFDLATHSQTLVNGSLLQYYENNSKGKETKDVSRKYDKQLVSNTEELYLQP